MNTPKDLKTLQAQYDQMVKIAYETAVPEKEGKGTTRVDYLKARNFLSEIKAKLGEMEKNLKLAELGLKMAMGLDPGASLVLANIPLEGLPRPSWNLEEMKERVLAKNVDLLISDVNAENIRARIPEWFRKSGLGQTFVLLPVVIDNRAIGLFYGEKAQAGELTIAPREMNLLKTLRNQAVLALRQRR